MNINEDILLLLTGLLLILLILAALGVGLDVAERLRARRSLRPWEPVRRRCVVGRPRDELDAVLDIVNGRKSA